MLVPRRTCAGARINFPIHFNIGRKSPRSKFPSLLAVLLAGALAACVYGGVAEFEAYKTAFDSVQSTSTSILDQLALQERRLFLKLNQNASNPRRFNPDLARYYTDSVDPPGTASFRAALATIKTYNDLLYGLETGQTAQALSAKLAALEASITSAVNDTAALAPSVSAQIQAGTTTINGLFVELQPFLTLALNAQSQAAFHDFLIQSYPTVRKLLWELRNSTAAIFPMLTSAVLDSAVGRPLTPDETSKISSYRKLLADWVILLETTVKALDAANAAATAPPTIVDRVTGLTTVASELDAAAKSARKNLASVASK